jgi:ABC-type transport system substrate-binding protein
MDKETLSNYGWIVICVLVMVVMITLATPFGRFVEQAVQNTSQGLFDTNKTALDAAGIIIGNNYIDQTNDAYIFYDKVYESVNTGAAGIWHRDGSITLYQDAVGEAFHIPASDVLIEGNVVSHTDPVCPSERQYYYVDWSGHTIEAQTYSYWNFDSTFGVYKERTEGSRTPTRMTEYATIEDWLASK